MKKQDGIYERKGGKYRYLGHAFTGFPADGIWLVQSGTKNQSCLIGSKEKVPIFALNYRLHEQELCKKLQETWKDQTMSTHDIARLACDYFTELAEEKK